jgi:hypothetical protein
MQEAPALPIAKSGHEPNLFRGNIKPFSTIIKCFEK